MRILFLLGLLFALSGCATPISSRCGEGFYRGSYLLGQQLRHSYFTGNEGACD